MKKPSIVEQNWLPASRQWKHLILCSKCLSILKGRKAISAIEKVSLAIAVASVNAGLFTELICTAQVFPRHLFSHVILFPLRTYPCHNLNVYLCFCVRDSSARSRTAMSEQEFHRGQTSRACSVSVMLAGAATGEREKGERERNSRRAAPAARHGTARGRPRSAFGRGARGGCARDEWDVREVRGGCAGDAREVHGGCTRGARGMRGRCAGSQTCSLPASGVSMASLLGWHP